MSGPFPCLFDHPRIYNSHFTQDKKKQDNH